MKQCMILTCNKIIKTFVIILISFRSASILGALLVLLSGSQQCVLTNNYALAPPEVSQHNATLDATCKMTPSISLAEGLPKVYGYLLFKQDFPHGKLKVLVQLNGFPEGDPEPRAVHVHQYGDLSQGCDSTGGHYNPYGVDHPNHPGDLGNFEPQQGEIDEVVESEATLFGGMSLIGRSVVVHEKRDDLGRGGDAGSLLHGNAGRRLCCCIIGISSPKLWNTQDKQFNRSPRSI